MRHNAATEESLESYNRYVISTIRSHLDTAKAFIIGEKWALAALRLSDMSVLVTQVSGQDVAWTDFAVRLRQMEQSFDRVENSEITWIPLRKKWLELMVDLSREIDRIDGPFPPPHRSLKMVSNETFRELLQRVLAKSKANEVHWDQLDKSNYRLTLPGNSVLAIGHESPQSAPNYYCAFLLVEQQLVARLVEEEGNTKDPNTSSLLEELYGECFRVVTGYDKAIEAIEDALKSALPIGEPSPKIPCSIAGLIIQSATYGAGQVRRDVTARNPTQNPRRAP